MKALAPCLVVLAQAIGCGDGSTSGETGGAGAGGSATTMTSASSGGGPAGGSGAGGDAGGAPGDGGAGPETCVRPTALNTGVPPGTVLTPQDGDITVTKDGTILDAIDLDGSVYIEAKDVTIRRSRIRGGIEIGHYPTYVASGVLIEDCEIGPDAGYGGVHGVYDRNFTLRRSNVHNFHLGVQANSNATIEHSYIHHPYANLEDGHEGIGVMSYAPFGPGSITLFCNDVDMGVPAPDGPEGVGNASYEGVDQDGGDPLADLVLDRNWFNGGSYTVYVLDHWQSVTATGNRWGHVAAYGPLHYTATVDGATPSPLVWTDNAFDDGEPIPAPSSR
ncbi:MAG: hypothetical protein HOW73_14005 [Polyangiaceae bacterium]|nr:hypothetical protein [Polyangiaceae bacterium]